MDMDSRLLKRLSEVVAAYGANPARWPKGERSRLEEAARENPRMLAEAHEIDRVLELASAPRNSQEGQARLLRAITHEGQAHASNVVSLPSRVLPRRSHAWAWAAAATLAASLAFGIYLGTLDTTDFLFSPDTAANDDPVDLAGLGDVSDYLEDQG
jgi:hypothetical protein